MDAGAGAELYVAIGGTGGCRRLAKAFYARVGRDPILRPLFPHKTLTCAIEEFAAFLVQFLGGPSQDAQRRWWLSLRESHLRFRIGPAEREAWLREMAAVLGDEHIAEPARSALLGWFGQASAYVVNSGEICPDAGEGLHPEIAQRWSAQLGLEDAVAAVRACDLGRATQLARGPVANLCGPAVMAGRWPGSSGTAAAPCWTTCAKHCCGIRGWRTRDTAAVRCYTRLPGRASHCRTPARTGSGSERHRRRRAYATLCSGQRVQ